jgi:hypothetical protein
MPKLSSRLLAFILAVALVLVAPLVIVGLLGLRTALTPPVSGTAFVRFDDLDVSGSCEDTPSTKGGNVLACAGVLRVDSLFAVVDHNTSAVSWCSERINDAHYDVQPPGHMGPLILGPLIISPMPVVPADWGSCADIVPRRSGLSLRLVLKH